MIGVGDCRGDDEIEARGGDLSDDLDRIATAVTTLSANGRTPMAQGIELASTQLSEKGRGRLIVLVTDGQPDKANAAAAKATDAKADDIRIFCVGIGDDVCEGFLKYEIASSPQEYRFAEKGDDLLGIFESILELYIVN